MRLSSQNPRRSMMRSWRSRRSRPRETIQTSSSTKVMCRSAESSASSQIRVPRRLVEWFCTPDRVCIVFCSRLRLIRQRPQSNVNRPTMRTGSSIFVRTRAHLAPRVKYDQPADQVSKTRVVDSHTPVASSFGGHHRRPDACSIGHESNK